VFPLGIVLSIHGSVHRSAGIPEPISQAMKLALLLPLLLTTAALAQNNLQQRAAALDRVLEAHWQANQLTPNPPASDETFLRRTYLDLAGRIPTAAEARSVPRIA
jgi:hypothetical protein